MRGIRSGLLGQIVAGELPLGLLPWVPLMADGGDDAIVAEWKRLGLLEPDSRRRADYGGLALVFAELTNRRDMWAEALKEWNMRESQTVNEWKKEGRLEGRLEGRVEGRVEGRLEGGREDLMKVLQARFPGEIHGELLQIFSTQQDYETLSRWLVAAATAPTFEQFRSHLVN